MKKNIFIGSRLRSRDREVIIFENYSCNSLFLATGGSIKEVLGYYWYNGRFSNHMVVTYLLLSTMILTHNVSVQLKHRYYLVKVCVNTNYIQFQTKQKQRRQSYVCHPPLNLDFNFLTLFSFYYFVLHLVFLWYRCVSGKSDLLMSFPNTNCCLVLPGETWVVAAKH